MKNKLILGITSLCFLGFLFICCSDDSDNGGDNIAQGSDVSKLLVNIYENGILFDYVNMLSLVEKHDLTLRQLKDNPTLENLNSAIEEDKQLNIAWDSIEIYRLQLLRVLYSDVQFFPLNTTSISENISAANSIDSSFFETLFDPTKGLLANSYLLNTFGIVDFTNEPKYTDFLIENLSYVKGNIQELESYWKDEGDSFVSATGRGLDQSVNLLVNVYINLLETIKLVKLEKPLLEKNISLTESPYNNNSIKLMQSNITALKTSFNGNFENSTTSYSFDDYLKAINREDLSIAVNTKIDEALRLSLNLNDFNDIVTNSSESANTFVEKINELLILFNVDIASALNLTVTFTDNDGD